MFQPLIYIMDIIFQVRQRVIFVDLYLNQWLSYLYHLAVKFIQFGYRIFCNYNDKLLWHDMVWHEW